MKRQLFLLAAAVLLLPLTTPAGETVNRIAAVVNDEIITTYELDRELAQHLEGSAAEALPSQEREALRRQILTKLIDESLIRQRGEELQIEVTDEEVEAAIEDVQRQNDLSRRQLIDALRYQGVSFEEYRQNLRDQILRFKLLGREVQARVDVTSQEVRDYFREHIDDFRQEPSMRLNRLSFPIPEKASGEQVEALRAKAEAALKRIREGEDFYTVLLASTADRTAEGGDMGEFAEGELTPAFDRGVKGLSEGEVSDLIETPSGFHILQVTERSPGKVRRFDSVQEEIRTILRERKTEERLREWSTELKEQAYIDIRL